MTTEEFEDELRDLINKAHESGIDAEQITSSLEIVKMAFEEGQED